jgi:hypothetical protein
LRAKTGRRSAKPPRRQTTYLVFVQPSAGISDGICRFLPFKTEIVYRQYRHFYIKSNFKRRFLRTFTGHLAGSERKPMNKGGKKMLDNGP